MTDQPFITEIPLKEQLIVIGAQQQVKMIEDQANEMIKKVWQTAARSLEEGLSLPKHFLNGNYSVDQNLLTVHNRTQDDYDRMMEAQTRKETAAAENEKLVAVDRS